MPFTYLLLIFLLLTFTRYSFLPAWPINFLPVLYLVWQNQKREFIWQLLLLGLVNDVFSTQTQFGLTAIVFTGLGLFTYLIDHWWKRSLVSFGLVGLLLFLFSQISLPSLLLLPAALGQKLLDKSQNYSS